MAQNGEIDLNQVKAKYTVKDIRLIDCREMDFANEYRLTFEISSAIGFTVLGNVISNFSWILFFTMLIFLVFGFFNLKRYLGKQKEIQAEDITPSVSLSKTHHK